MTSPTRCLWAGDDPLMVAYHDDEWGVPSYDDRHLFEMLTLEGAQAGLSWTTILRKRGGYRAAFQDYDATAVAAFGPGDVERLVVDSSIVRNRAKIESTISNARAILALREGGTGLAAFIWGLVEGAPVQNAYQRLSDLPAETPQSKAMSRELKRRGLRFVGPTICYALMQSVGLVNDHVSGCFRYAEVRDLAGTRRPH